MTSRDVRDIMDLGTPVASSSAPPAPRPVKQKRPDGITRELYALIGDNAPSLALAHSAKPKFKERIKRVGPNVKWRWTPFTNPSRTAATTTNWQQLSPKEKEARGKLRLSHWVRDLPEDHVDGAPEHKFAKYNTTSGVFSYTTEEYNLHLREDDWPREETDHLFSLAHQYDLRFIIMADRWDYPSERTVEDLKARYYSVCRTLVMQRPTQDESVRKATLATLSFDKAREQDRKAYLRSLLSRTPAQIAEEDFLYIESRRLEQSYNKIAAERAELLRLLGGRDGIGAQPGGVHVGGGGGGAGGIKGSGGNVGGPAGSKEMGNKDVDKKRKGQTGWEIEGLNGGGLPEGWQGEGSKRKATVAQDIANCIERHAAPSVSAPKALLYPSVSIRSSRINAPKPTVAVKVHASLAELGISSHLIMPTKANVERLDALQTALAQMVDLKKAVDRIEGELRVVNKRKDGLLGVREGSAIKEEEGEGSQRGQRESSSALRNKRSASQASSTGTHKRARKD